MTRTDRNETDGSGKTRSSVARPRLRRRRVRLADVALSAGVSSMTVSRVVNEIGSVTAATRDHVQSVIRRLGYTPDAAARSLTLARTERIAVLHDDSRTAFLGRLLIGVLSESQRMSAQVLVRRVESQDPSAWRVIRDLLDDGVSGVLLPPPLGDLVRLVDGLRAEGIPFVALSAGTLSAQTIHVGIDDHAAAYEMAQHLLALGHRRIGFIRGPVGWSAGEERWHGFVAALVDAGIDAGQIQVVKGQCTFRSGIEAARTLLELRPVPTAIFASCDTMAAAAIATAHHLGLRVPDTLTVVGFDDDIAARATWPELTTVRQPISEMAVQAVALLLAAIRRRSRQAQPSYRKKVLRHSLILRDSTAPPPPA